MAVNLQTWGEQLQEVRNAISAVYASQRYEINGRMVQRADLQWLHQHEKFLTEKLEQQGDVIVGSNVSRGAFGVSFS